jgi:uncharacterized protein (UPF0297 family)
MTENTNYTVANLGNKTLQEVWSSLNPDTRNLLDHAIGYLALGNLPGYASREDAVRTLEIISQKKGLLKELFDFVTTTL